jgi:hypothetical protein
MTAAESQALGDLEELLGTPIPASSEEARGAPGFTAEAGRVVGLRCQAGEILSPTNREIC